MPRGDGRLNHDCSSTTTGPARTPAGSSASGPPAKRSPSSPTSGSTRCSTAARSPPGIAVSDGQPDPGLQGHGPGRPGLRRVAPVSRCRATSRSGTAATPRPGRACGRTRSRRSAPPRPGRIALGHNGNLTNTGELSRAVEELRPERGELPLHGTPAMRSTSDTDLLTDAARLAPRPVARGGRARGAAAGCAGAFSLVWMDETTLYAARDPQGIRPLVLGRLERGWVVASETAALDIVGASFVREVEPGELVAIDEHGLRTQRFAEAEPQGLPVRVRLPGPPRHHDQRPQHARGPGRDGPAAGRARRRSTPTW